MVGTTTWHKSKTSGLLREVSIGLKKWLNTIRWWWFPANGGGPKQRTNPAAHHIFLWWPWQHFQTFLYFFFFLFFFFSKYLLGYHCHLPNDLQHCPQGKMKYEEDSARRKFILAWEDWLWFAGLKKNNLKA